MVEVFSTNIKTEKQADLLLEYFRRKFPDYKINFDLEDCDHILRIECHYNQIDAESIMEMVKDFGLVAEILPDGPLGTKFKL